MATETVRTSKPAEPTPETAPGAEFFGGVWDTALNFQRQWASFWTRPLGQTPTADQMWQQWHLVNTEWLNHTRRTAELTNDLVADQVKMAREFSEKSLDMTREITKREPKDVTPELAKACFDTSRRSAERTFEFGTDSLRAVEEFGLRVAETLVRAPAAAK